MSPARAFPPAIVTGGLALAILIASPSSAAAQRPVFVEGLLELTAAVAGTYGDEGPAILAALDKMDRALAEWDRSIREAESQAAADGATRDPAAAFRRSAALAGLYAERGRLDDALREIDVAARLEPRHADLHLLRATVLRAAGRSQEAGDAFVAAWRLDEADAAKAYLALRHGGVRRPDEVRKARAAMQRAYERIVGDEARTGAPPFFRIGLLQDGAAASPILPLAAYAPAYALLERGEYPRAIAVFRETAAADPLLDPAAASVPMRQAAAALRQGRPREAQTHLAIASAAAPDASEPRRLLGLAAYGGGSDAESLAHLDAAVRARPRDERARLALARVLVDGGRYADAERVLRATLDVLPGSALARWWLATVYERLNRVTDARQEMEHASRLAVLTGRGRVHDAIGRLSRTAGEFSRALDAFTRNVRLNPNAAAARRQLAQAYLEQDRVDDALAELVAALLVDPRDGEAHAAIGQVHLDAGRNLEAVAALTRALALRPSLADARYGLATALMRLGRREEASRELEAFERERREALAARRRDIADDVRRERAALSGTAGTAR